jgi:hypothetical protein
MSTHETHVAVERLREEVAAMREAFEYVLLRTLRQQDREDLAALLPLVAEVMGASSWTVADVYVRALATPSADELQQLLAEWSTEVGGRRSLGRLLERGVGSVFGGLRLVEIGAQGRDGLVYTLKRVSAGQKPA